MSDKIQILFVDDEPNLLASLKRMMRVKQKEWDMTFENSAIKALKFMEKNDPAVIVSDIRMPEMDGAEFLARAKDTHPMAIRIALSGQVDLNEVIRSIKAVHQYISKPCDAHKLIEKIEGALRSRRVLTDNALLEVVTNIESLPIVQKIFLEISEELEKEEPSIDNVATLIAQDVGLVAKIINLVNSPYFGLPANVDSVQKAITMLGLETIKALVLTTQIFSMHDENKVPQLNIGLLWEHSFRVSNIARLIAECEGLDNIDVAKCRMAGLLHDVGKLVLSSQYPEEYGTLLDSLGEEGRTVCQAESEVFGTTHAEVGAYLMGLWGVGGDLVYGIGHHHCRVSQESDIALITHVANVIDHNFFIIHEEYTKRKLDGKLSHLLEGTEKMAKWIDYIRAQWDYWENSVEGEVVLGFNDGVCR